MKRINKKGFFQNLSVLAIGLVVFAVVVVIGTVVLGNLSATTSNCNAGFNYSSSAQLCQNNSGINFGNATPALSAVTGNYLTGQLGSTSGGLASWVPAIIAIAVGVLVIGAIALIGSSKKY